MNWKEDWSMGFAVITGIVLIAVFIYTIIMLRKQVSRKRSSEKKKAVHKD